VVRYRLIIAPANVPLRRIGYMGGLAAIGQVPGITWGEGMAQGSRVLMRSGSGTSTNAAEVMRSTAVEVRTGGCGGS